MKSELKWREVDVLSTFITVGELRALICDKLNLDQKTDTVTLISETDQEPFSDSKQLPRGSRLRAIRTTHDQLERAQAEKEEAAKKAAEAAEQDAEQADDTHGAGCESEDEFGPSVFDVEAQRRYQQRQAAAAACAKKAAQEKREAEQREAAEAARSAQLGTTAADPSEDAKKGACSGCAKRAATAQRATLTGRLHEGGQLRTRHAHLNLQGAPCCADDVSRSDWVFTDSVIPAPEGKQLGYAWATRVLDLHSL
jgi:DWNN domain